MFAIDRVEEVAKKHGATMAQVALAWTMAKDGMHFSPSFALYVATHALSEYCVMRTTVVCAPSIGTTSLEKLEDLLGTCRPS